MTTAPIVILDEALAPIEESEREPLGRLLLGMLSERTLIQIAHSLQDLAQYNRIIVLDKGVVVEADAPEELVKKKGNFHRMISTNKYVKTKFYRQPEKDVPKVAPKKSKSKTAVDGATDDASMPKPRKSTGSLPAVSQQQIIVITQKPDAPEDQTPPPRLSKSSSRSSRSTSRVTVDVISSKPSNTPDDLSSQ